MDHGACSYRRFLDGDESAFDEIMKELFHGLVFFVDRYVHDVHAAEDIAIDAFSDLIVHKHRYNFKVTLKTYLYMIGRSRALDYLKHRKVIEFTELSEAVLSNQMNKNSFMGELGRLLGNENLPPELAEQTGKLLESDELGKLMKESSDDSGNVAFFKNDEIVFGVSVDYFPNGYDFEIEVAAEGHERGFEEDMVYRVNTTEKTLTKYVDDHGDLVDGTDMPLSEHRDKYDFLLSIVPHTYIRSIIDMDKAEKRKESVGLVTVYEMKDENGNVTADMKLAFGKIGEVIHYTGENEYVQIELEY